MNIKTHPGFTIIETMLFLGVSGMLAVAILVGSGVAIGQQRYRDSVNSLKSFIQEQYSNSTSVTNNRDESWTCSTNAAISSVLGLGGQPRGTSNCVLLGRFITIDDTGTKLTSSNVVGYRTPGASEAASDIAELSANYRVAISPIDQETTEISWGAQVVKPATTNPMPLSIFIVRSPLSGSILTFSTEGVHTDLGSLMTADNLSHERHLCVNADAGSFVGKRLEVKIDAYAASQGAVHIPIESESTCG